MLLNNIAITSYSEQEDCITFVFADGVKLSDITSIDSEMLTLSDSYGSDRVWKGYILSCAFTDGTCQGVFVRKLDDSTAQAIEALEANVSTAMSAADEAKTLAEEAGTDPQLQALAAMQVSTMDLTKTTATTLAGFKDYWPDWKAGKEYKQNDPLRWNGLYYRASQDHTSQKIYPPDTAGESMYYPVTIAPDGVIVYRECHGQYDQVLADETRHYPDAEGPVYRAKVDTAYDPDTVPDNWELVEDE